MILTFLTTCCQRWLGPASPAKTLRMVCKSDADEYHVGRLKDEQIIFLFVYPSILSLWSDLKDPGSEINHLSFCFFSLVLLRHNECRKCISQIAIIIIIGPNLPQSHLSCVCFCKFQCLETKGLRQAYELYQLTEVGENWRLLGDSFQESMF